MTGLGQARQQGCCSNSSSCLGEGGQRRREGTLCRAGAGFTARPTAEACAADPGNVVVRILDSASVGLSYPAAASSPASCPAACPAAAQPDACPTHAA
jgi:hypothetical protein